MREMAIFFLPENRARSVLHLPRRAPSTPNELLLKPGNQDGTVHLMPLLDLHQSLAKLLLRYLQLLQWCNPESPHSSLLSRWHNHYSSSNVSQTHLNP